MPFAYAGELLKRTPGAVMRAALLCIVPAMAVVVLFKRDSAHETSPYPGAKLIRGVTFGVPALLAANLAREHFPVRAHGIRRFTFAQNSAILGFV